MKKTEDKKPGFINDKVVFSLALFYEYCRNIHWKQELEKKKKG